MTLFTEALFLYGIWLVSKKEKPSFEIKYDNIPKMRTNLILGLFIFFNFFIDFILHVIYYIKYGIYLLFKKPEGKNKLMAIHKINKPEPLAKMALDVLRHSILTKELSTGVLYNEKTLADSLGISRTPVREALLELSSKRLVKFLPQKGVIINTFSNKEIEEIFEIRAAFELLAIKKTCLNYKTLDQSYLQKCLMNQKNAIQLEETAKFIEADRSFHSYFIKHTDNNYLMEMMQDIRDIIQLMGLKGLETKGRMQEVVREHESIVSAVEKGNVSNAIKQMEYHLKTSEKAVKINKPEEDKNGKTGNRI